MTFYEPRLPCDATQIGRFRSPIGEVGVEELLKATIDTAVMSNVIKLAEFERLNVGTTVQEKAVAHPVDSRLLEIAHHKVVVATKRAGIALKQTFARRRARHCGAKTAATPPPRNSSACARWSNAGSRSWVVGLA
jgi:transposase, IS5 family